MPKALVSGLILAGGRGLRLGGVNKGLQAFAGKRLIEHAIDRIRPQVRSIYISANADEAAYQKLGFPVLPDGESTLYQGPLAGMLAGLQACSSSWLLCAPCDTPYFPLDLGQRLWEVLLDPARPEAVKTLCASRIASDLQSERPGPKAAFVAQHPVFCLLHQGQAQHLAQFLSQGGRRVRDWHTFANSVALSWEDARVFTNLNRKEDWN